MLPCGNCALKDAENRVVLFIRIAVKDAVIEKLDNYIEQLVQSNTEREKKDLEWEKKDLERDKKLDKYMEFLFQSSSEKDLENSNGKCEIRQLKEKTDEILSRLTSLEDGMEKLKMEVTEVKMEVNNIVKTCKSGFSKRRG
jgi:chromosome segregation ATPase